MAPGRTHHHAPRNVPLELEVPRPHRSVLNCAVRRAESREPLKPDHGACPEPLIPREALARLLGLFAMPPRHRWRPRPMNILDPLQDLNNLGRSVSKASHQRMVLAMRNVTNVIDDMCKNVVRAPLFDLGVWGLPVRSRSASTSGNSADNSGNLVHRSDLWWLDASPLWRQPASVMHYALVRHC